MRRTASGICLALALALPAAFAGRALAGPPSGSGEEEGAGSAVTARLISDTATIAAGRPFQVAVEIRMAPGWHTYWENGGDAGLPTTVDWELPEGFEAGPIRWPVPHRYAEEGDVVTFGYAERVLLLVDVTPPDRIDAESVPLRGRAEWLQCKDICIPGGAELELVLPVGTSPVPAPEPVLQAFAAAREQLPRSATGVDGGGIQAFQSVAAVPPGAAAEAAVVFLGIGDADPAGCVFLPRSSETIWMRDGRFRSDGEHLALVIPIEIDTAVEPGSVVSLSGVVRIARPGGEDLLSFEIPVNIGEAGEEARPTPFPVFAPDGPVLAAETGGGSTAAGGTGGGLLRFLVLAFLGGLVLNVMPCVLPVVSLKILGFVSKAEEHPGKVAQLGWTFAAGVVTSFLVLALLVIALKSAGEHIGWGFQFQNPVFVAALAVVVFVFALSLLGVFEVGATFSMLGLGLAAKERKDHADAFFHGVLTTILATPCTAPMLGAAIAFAFTQSAAVILLIFFAVSVGLAAPYVLLSLNPAWLRYVPKPGVWMDRFKQGMGFLLLATLVWLLFVFGAQMGTDSLVFLLAFLLVVGFFAWMHGAFLDLTSSSRKAAIIWVLTIAGVGLSYRAFLHERLFGAAEAMAAETPGARTEVTKGGIRWEPFTTAYLEESVADGRTVFLDLTADWCWTCKVNERTVLADDEVESAFQENGVLTLKGDWTRKDPEITEILRRHGRAGVPFYAVFPAGRLSEVIVLPEVINKRLVIDSIERAGPSRAEPDV